MLKPNNIFNNLLNEDDSSENDLSDEEQMIFNIDINNSNENIIINEKYELIDIEFNKILGYDKKKYLDQIGKFQIYNDLNNRYKFKKFFVEFYNDFVDFIPNYKIKEKILLVLENNNFVKKINYNDLIDDSIKYCYGNQEYIKNILLSDDDKIEYLINKYNEINLSGEILPIDSTTNIIIDSSNKYNISNIIISYLINNGVTIKYDLLMKIIDKISYPNDLITEIIDNLKLEIDDLTEEQIEKIHKNITLKTFINTNDQTFYDEFLLGKKNIINIIILN